MWGFDSRSGGQSADRRCVVNLSQTGFLLRSKIPASGDRYCPECQYGNAREAEACSLCGVALAEAEAARRTAHLPKAPPRESRERVVRSILTKESFKSRRRTRHRDLAFGGLLTVVSVGVVLDLVFAGPTHAVHSLPRHLFTGLALGAPLGFVSSLLRLGPVAAGLSGTVGFVAAFVAVQGADDPVVVATAACLGLLSGWVCGTHNTLGS